MDRFEHSIKSVEDLSSRVISSVESSLFSTLSNDATYALFAPLHYEREYTYPLIVWLHGQGTDERELMRVMPLVSMRNYVAVAPRGVCVPIPSASGREGYGWPQSDRAMEQAEETVFGSIDAIRERFHFSRRRIFIAGFGSGGTMAFRIAMNHPRRFAGVLSLCGPFPSGRTPFGNLSDARRLPVFLAVGRDSREYPPTEVCKNLRLFHTAGIATTLRQYPCGQEIGPQMLADMDRWIIEEITSGKVSGDEPSDR